MFSHFHSFSTQNPSKLRHTKVNKWEEVEIGNSYTRTILCMTLIYKAKRKENFLLTTHGGIQDIPIGFIFPTIDVLQLIKAVAAVRASSIEFHDFLKILDI